MPAAEPTADPQPASSANTNNTSSDPAKKNKRIQNPDSKKDDDKNDNLEESAKRYRDALKKKQREQYDERARILKLLETDRKERRARQSYGKSHPDEQASTPEPQAAGASPASASGSASSSKPGTPVAAAGAAARRPSTHCALLVRLFDGQALRHKFEATDTLTAVRAFVDEASSSSTGTSEGLPPYTFFNPLSRQTFGESEEAGSTLAELGLTPSATLVLKPIRTSVSSAYGGGISGSGVSGGGIVGGLTPYGLVESGVRSVYGAVSTFLGIGYVPARLREQQAETERLQREQRDALQRQEAERAEAPGSSEVVAGEEDGEAVPSSSGSSSSGNDSALSHDGLTRRHGGAVGLDEPHAATGGSSARIGGFSGTNTPSGLGTRYSSTTSFHDLISLAAASADSAAASGSSGGAPAEDSEADDRTASGKKKKKGREDRVTYNGNNLSLEDGNNDSD